jgi:hypothetical protein
LHCKEQWVPGTLGFSLVAALLDGLFEHPEWNNDTVLAIAEHSVE